MQALERVRETAGLEDTVQWASDAATEAYYRALEYARANPRNAALIATGVGLGLGWLLSRATARRALGGLLSSVVLAAGGAALDALRGEVR
jgi:hypothetical protein